MMLKFTFENEICAPDLTHNHCTYNGYMNMTRRKREKDTPVEHQPECRPVLLFPNLLNCLLDFLIQKTYF